VMLMAATTAEVMAATMAKLAARATNTTTVITRSESCKV
jgi:hypothetical protein